MITVVVFDLDDTLYDEVRYCGSGFAAVADYLAALSGSVPADRIFAAFWWQFSAGNRSNTFNAALDELEIPFDETLVKRLVDVYRNHNPVLRLPDASRSVLDQLKKRHQLALLTDGFLPAQKLKVQALAIEDYFASIVYTEQLGRDCWKPSPAGFEKIMHDLGAKPENMVYIADNEEKDFIAPNNLGMSTVRLIRPAGMHTADSHETAARARYRVHDIGQIPALIEQL